MTATTRPAAPTRPSPDPLRRTSLAAGVLYLLTFVSVPTLMVFRPVQDGARYVLGAGSEVAVLWGSAAEVVVALACVGTAVVLFPVVRRQSETAALGFVAARIVEGSLILVGVVSMLTLTSLRSDAGAGLDEASLVTAGTTLATTYGWTFLLSQSLMPVVNALCLGYALYRSRLVPRVLPTVGLVGAPLLLASDIAIFFGVYDRLAPVAALAALPIAAWELALGVYLVVRGFRPEAVAALPAGGQVR